MATLFKFVGMWHTDMIDLYQNAIILYTTRGHRHYSLVAKKRYNHGVTSRWVDVKNGEEISKERHHVKDGSHVVEKGVLIESRKIRIRSVNGRHSKAKKRKAK